MKQLKEPEFILLIDDDEATNFIHEIVIRSSGIKSKFQSVRTGKEALRVLKEYDEQTTIVEGRRGIVFLDINMPAMNGWEFLTEYRRIPMVEAQKIVTVILTTSMNPDDKERADAAGDLFLNKPLTKESLIAAVEKYSA